MTQSEIDALLQQNYIVIFTDGGASGNPGPGGWGAVLLFGKNKKELGGGFAHTTNNRMELFAVISALEALKHDKYKVALFSDSRYVVDSITKGWAHKWKTNGWKKADKKRAENVDLWEKLLQLLQKLDVQFHWVKGHANIDLNERCDQIAKEWMYKNELPNDTGYKGQ